ncbi:MAG: PorV/PorQ family protein [Calditrichaeota bacterium]|nr:PorV/PorQ family protein [Calditrichota bacterium]RQW02872.1 MAG: PorV/PorQ family protein [Calditrichota bacterium]
MRILVVCLTVFMFLPLFVINGHAQGEATVLFLIINPGARQGGMGEAGVALADDANAIYWNPAGLAFQYTDPEVDRKGEANLMHVNWLPQFNLSDMYYDYAAGRYHLEDIGTVGLAIQYISYGESIYTGEAGPEELGRFNSSEVSVTGSYALKVRDNLGLGVNLKYIYSRLSPFEVQVGAEKGKGIASGFGVDLGVLYHPTFAPKLSLGANISNIGPKISYVDYAQADPLPTNLRLGFAYHLVKSEFNTLTFVYDTNRLLVNRDSTTVDGVFKAMLYSSWTNGDFFKKFTHSFGVEYWYTDLIALRAGYFYEDPSYGGRKFYTFGGGLRYSVFGFDFSYILGSVEDSPLSDTMRFSLGIRF